MLIIDISEKVYSALKNERLEVLNRISGEQIVEVFQKGIPLDRCTNGEVIKALFPHIETEVIEDITDVYNMGNHRVTFDTEWWNSPYKGE